jgi:Domain of unknown function (DUF1707)
MDTESRGFPRGDIRVSDAERDRALGELSEHFQTGRLTQDEFDERSGLALKARTGGDLDALFGDLPRRPSVPETRFTGVTADPGPGPGAPGRTGRVPVLRVVIPLAILAIIAGNLFGAHHGHGTFSWLLPVVVLGLIFARMARRR